MGQPLAVRDIGVPVRSVNWVRLFAARDVRGAPCICAAMGQQGGPLFVLSIDIRTGACEQVRAPLPHAHYPTAAFWSDRQQCLFVGSHPGGNLLRYRPWSARLEDLGQINPGQADFPCQIDEAPDSTLYIGSYGACDLTRYDPRTGEFRRFGRMDDVDQYLYPLCSMDGTVAGLVRVTRPHVVALDPATGEHQAVGPVADTDARQGHVALIKGRDGLLYIRSHDGDFRLEGLEAIRVDRAPDPMPAPSLPDGSTFRFLDEGDQLFMNRRLAITGTDGKSRVFEIGWEGDGTEIYLVRPGPDGGVYGSSLLPLHLFSYDPAADRLVDHGACSTSGGEVYSMGILDGRLYTCAYPAAKLSVYDPARPYRFGTDPEANPRELGRMDDVAYRPRAMLCGPAGKVWVASIPDYGMWGGTLAWYDPASSRFGSHRHIIRDCSPVALAHITPKDLIAVGFSIYGGSGTTPRSQRAGFCLWNPVRDCEVWQGDLGLHVLGVMDMCAAGDGLTYAIVHLAADRPHAELMLLDLPQRQIVSRAVIDAEQVGWPLEVSLQGDGRFVYGATLKGIYRVARGTTEVEMLWTGEGGDWPTCAGAQVGGAYYFGTCHRLRAASL